MYILSYLFIVSFCRYGPPYTTNLYSVQFILLYYILNGKSEKELLKYSKPKRFDIRLHTTVFWHIPRLLKVEVNIFLIFYLK